MPFITPSSANRSMNPWASRTSPSAKWYARRTSASISVVTVISPPEFDQDESTFTSGKVRGHHRIPVIVDSCRPEFLSADGGAANHRDPVTISHLNGGEHGASARRFTRVRRE